MSDFPKNRRELERADYRMTSASAVCKGCGAAIEWWKTKNGKSIPMNPIPNDYAPAVVHFTTCPHAKDFQGGNSTAAPEKRSVLGPSAGEEARRLRERLNARVVVVVTDMDTFAYYRAGLPPEDLRQDLFSAGNFVRAEIQKQEDKG